MSCHNLVARLGAFLLGASVFTAALAETPLPLVKGGAFDIAQTSAGQHAAVAIDGDRLVLGLPDAAVDGNTGAGTLWTWRTQGGHWTPEAEAFSLADLSQPLTGSPHFGTAVAASGDLVLVGCPRCGTSGKAFLLVWRDDHWQKYTIDGDFIEGAGQFGTSVALAGDQIAIGAPTSGSTATPGAVWLGRFDRTGIHSVVMEQMWFGEQDNERFGAALAFEAMVQNVTQEIGHYLLVGAPDYRNGALDRIGRAQMLQRTPDGNWAHMASFANTSPTGDDRFGAAVALWRPHSTQASYVAIGIPGSSHFEPGAGAVLLYRLQGGNYEFERIVQHPGGGLDDAFGSSVSLNGARLLVGAPGFDPVQGPDAGAAYVFARDSAGDWLRAQSLFPRNDDGLFGTAVAWSGNDAAIVTPLAGIPGEPANRVQTYVADLIFADDFE